MDLTIVCTGSFLEELAPLEGFLSGWL